MCSPTLKADIGHIATHKSSLLFNKTNGGKHALTSQRIILPSSVNLLRVHRRHGCVVHPLSHLPNNVLSAKSVRRPPTIHDPFFHCSRRPRRPRRRGRTAAAATTTTTTPSQHGTGTGVVLLFLMWIARAVSAPKGTPVILVAMRPGQRASRKRWSLEIPVNKGHCHRYWHCCRYCCCCWRCCRCYRLAKWWWR